MKKLFKWVGIVIMGLFVLGFIVEAAKSPEEKAAEKAEEEKSQAKMALEKKEQAKQEQASLPVVTAAEIARAYNDNTVAADQRFKDKKFVVSGTIVEINTSFTGSPYLTLRGGVNEFMEPQFSFDDSFNDQIAKLKKGMKIKMTCEGEGDIAKTPLCGSCILLH